MLQPVAQIERYMRDWLSGSEMATGLREAVAYGLLGGGKRVRPVLCLRCCGAVGGQEADALPAAAAVEMIHAFSLVHDDLPAMDDDDLRRGRPTLHRHAGEAMAILAGDVLQTLAVEVLTEEVVDAATCRGLIRELCEATRLMIGGQVLDTLPEAWAQEEAASPEERLEMIHLGKTGALLRAACRMGAISGGADGSELAAITAYAEAIGLMFQIVDDLLDVTESPEQTGKATGKDAAAGKLTYPGVLGVEASRAEVGRLEKRALSAIAGLGDRAEPLREWCGFLARRRK